MKKALIYLMIGATTVTLRLADPDIYGFMRSFYDVKSKDGRRTLRLAILVFILVWPIMVPFVLIDGMKGVIKHIACCVQG